MIQITAPIFTEEYKIKVIIWTEEEIIKCLVKYWIEEDTATLNTKRWRGSAYNTLSSINKHPIIAINWDFDYTTSLATIAHEACHAMDYIMEFLWVEDHSWEFRAHWISSVMRHVLKKIDINKVKE